MIWLWYNLGSSESNSKPIINKVVFEEKFYLEELEEGKASKEEYPAAKKAFKHAVTASKKVAEEKKFGYIKEHHNWIF